ncbi:MAG: Stage 0 sporulation protein YaaT, partial [uncultured Gemmatimonadaceae bacterium]
APAHRSRLPRQPPGVLPVGARRAPGDQGRGDRRRRPRRGPRARALDRRLRREALRGRAARRRGGAGGQARAAPRDGRRPAPRQRDRRAEPRSPAPRDGAGARARARDEALGRRVAVGPQEGHVLLHGREARRLPAARARPGGDVPRAHRAQADRGPRRGQAPRRHRPVRPPVLLGRLAPRAAPGEPRRRQGPASLAQPVADLGRVRAPDVLPPLRARLLRAEPQALPQGGEDPRHRARRGEGRRERHLPRPRDAAHRRGGGARRGARGAEARDGGGRGWGGRVGGLRERPGRRVDRRDRWRRRRERCGEPGHRRARRGRAGRRGGAREPPAAGRRGAGAAPAPRARAARDAAVRAGRRRRRARHRRRERGRARG